MNAREENPSDCSAVDRLVRDVFGGNYQPELVARLRSDNLVIVALVAEVEEQIIGHIVLSRLTAQVDGRPIRAAALAPVAVRSDYQLRGIGSRLVATAIEHARRA